MARPALRGSIDALLIGAVVVVLGAALLAALGLRPPTLADRTRSLESELRCPVCQGLSIADSPAELAVGMRSVVAARLAAGASDADVRAYFVERYGSWILLAPDPAGPNLLLWAIPGLLLVAGATAVVARSRQRQSRATLRPGSAAAASRQRPLLFGLAAAIVIAAVAIPMAVAVTPRSSGQEITGGIADRAAPSIEQLAARVNADPADVGSLVALGDAYVAAGRPAEAGDAYGRALKAEPDDVGALIGLGSLLVANGRPADAVALLDRAVAVAPGFPDAYFYRAIARYQLAGSLTADARADVLRFLTLAPNDPRRTLADRLLAAPSPSAMP